MTRACAFDRQLIVAHIGGPEQIVRKMETSSTKTGLCDMEDGRMELAGC